MVYFSAELPREAESACDHLCGVTSGLGYVEGGDVEADGEGEGHVCDG